MKIPGENLGRVCDYLDRGKSAYLVLNGPSDFNGIGRERVTRGVRKRQGFTYGQCLADAAEAAVPVDEGAHGSQAQNRLIPTIPHCSPG